jgi:hypothetical protein
LIHFNFTALFKMSGEAFAAKRFGWLSTFALWNTIAGSPERALRVYPTNSWSGIKVAEVRARFRLQPGP